MLRLFLTHFLFSKRAGSVIRSISWLTYLGMSVSVAALVIVLSVMAALNRRVQERTLAAEPHLFVGVRGVDQVDILRDHPVNAKLSSYPGWTWHLVENQDVILRTAEGRFQGAVARGYDAQGLKLVLGQVRDVQKAQSASGSESGPETETESGPGHESESESESNEDLELNLAGGEIIVGVDLAHSLGVFEGDYLMVLPPESLLLPPGETPIIERVLVRRILATNLSEVDSKAIFYKSTDTLKKLSKSASRHIGFEVWTTDSMKVDEYKNQVENLSGVYAETWKSRNSALFFALILEKLAIGVFLALASLVASFSLFSVMGLLISQKRREFGLLLVLGYSSRDVVNLISRIGIGLGFAGLLTGTVCGTLVSIYLEKYPLKILPDIYYDSDIPALVDPWFVGLVFVVGMLLVAIGAKLIAREMRGLNPSELLKSQARAQN